MGRFWIPNAFVRVHAKSLSSSAQSVYMVLCCHAGKGDETFISYSKIADLLDFSKNTVKTAVDDLIAYQLLVRLNKKTGRASHLKVLPVPNNSMQPYQSLGAKECNKEFIKENIYKNFLKRKNEPEPIGNVIAKSKEKYSLDNLRADHLSGELYRKKTKND